MSSFLFPILSLNRLRNQIMEKDEGKNILAAAKCQLWDVT